MNDTRIPVGRSAVHWDEIRDFLRTTDRGDDSVLASVIHSRIASAPIVETEVGAGQKVIPLTHVQFAELLDAENRLGEHQRAIDVASVRAMMHGGPPLHPRVMQKIACALDVSAEDLLVDGDRN